MWLSCWHVRLFSSWCINVVNICHAIEKGMDVWWVSSNNAWTNSCCCCITNTCRDCLPSKTVSRCREWKSNQASIDESLITVGNQCWNKEIDNENNDDTVQNESNIQDMDSIVSSTTQASINQSCMNNIPDVSSGMTLPVCDHVISWIFILETNRDVLGTAHSAVVKTMTDKVKEIAKSNTNKEYQNRQLRRMKVLQGLSEKF